MGHAVGCYGSLIGLWWLGWWVMGDNGCGGSLIGFWYGWVFIELWFVGWFLAGLGR